MLWIVIDAGISEQCRSRVRYAIYGCSRSIRNMSLRSIGRHERLQPPTLICSTASANVSIQGVKVVHFKCRHRLLWVGTASPGDGEAIGRAAPSESSEPDVRPIQPTFMTSGVTRPDDCLVPVSESTTAAGDRLQSLEAV